MKLDCTRAQFFTSSSSMSNTSHCFAEKNVAGPVGGPSSGGTTTRRFPPGRIPLSPSSKPGIIPLIPSRVDAGTPLRYVLSMVPPFSLYATYSNVTSCPSLGRSPFPKTKSLYTKPSSCVTNPSAVSTLTSYPSRTNVGNSSGALLYCLIFWLFSMAFASSSVRPRFCRSAVYFTRAAMSGASPTGTSSKGISTTSSDESSADADDSDAGVVAETAASGAASASSARASGASAHPASEATATRMAARRG
mmetsp:Transcript_1331/g.5573  ORF Transcript_1331/g.5573 Transcript_1331/m.5573 type:complete len:249 (+) Transcript_1331:94-840(+)